MDIFRCYINGINLYDQKYVLCIPFAFIKTPPRTHVHHAHALSRQAHGVEGQCLPGSGGDRLNTGSRARYCTTDSRPLNTTTNPLVVSLIKHQPEKACTLDATVTIIPPKPSLYITPLLQSPTFSDILANFDTPEAKSPPTPCSATETESVPGKNVSNNSPVV